MGSIISEGFFRAMGAIHVVIALFVVIVGFVLGLNGFFRGWSMFAVWGTAVISSIPFWFVAALMYWLAEVLENIKLIRDDIQSIRQDTTYATKMTHEFYQSLKNSK